MAYRSGDLTALVQGDHTDQVHALEDATTTRALGDLNGDLDTLARTSLAGWVTAFGGPSAAATAGAALGRLVAAVRAAVRRLLDRLGPRAAGAIRDSLVAAVRLGAEQGAEFLRAASGRKRGAPRVRVPGSLREEASHVAELVADRRDRALALLGRGHVTRWSDLLHGIGAARSAGAAVRGHTAWVVNRAVSAALDAVTKQAGLSRLWVSEAQACVRCLAYAGLVVPVGRPFPGGLSWDPRQRHTGAPGIDGPPEHPHCRCRCVPWSPHWTTSGIPFPEALRREAQRSLAYGRALPTESRAARLRAARELLRTEPDLLPAVEATARTAVRTGRFPVAA